MRLLGCTLLVVLASGCFLSPSWRQHRSDLKQLRREAQLSRVRYCVDHPESCGPNGAVVTVNSQAEADAARERKAKRMQAVGNGLQAWDENNRNTAQLMQGAPTPAPTPPPRPVNCTTTSMGANTYTNCY